MKFQLFREAVKALRSLRALGHGGEGIGELGILPQKTVCKLLFVPALIRTFNLIWKDFV